MDTLNTKWIQFNCRNFSYCIGTTFYMSERNSHLLPMGGYLYCPFHAYRN